MSLLAVVALFSLFHFVMEQNVVYSIIYSAGATLAGFILTDTTLTKVERDRILVIYIVAFFVIFFGLLLNRQVPH